MGITIDDSIRYIKDLRDARGCGYQQANIAIETMRKYQKIQGIVEHYRENVRDKVTNENMEKILEVIDNGNGD